MNLLDNAMKYSSSDVDVTLDANYRKVFISVIDQGIGIPEAELEQIFESFYRVDKGGSRTLGGTGLGLTIVKRLVGTHKRRINVRSRLGEGSLFKLELPRFIDYEYKNGLSKRSIERHPDLHVIGLATPVGTGVPSVQKYRRYRNAGRMRREHEKTCPFSFPLIAVSNSKDD